MISRISAGNYIGKYALSGTQEIPVFFQCMLGGGTSIVFPLPFCIKLDKLIAVDNLNLRKDCPPLNNE